MRSCPGNWLIRCAHSEILAAIRSIINFNRPSVLLVIIVVESYVVVCHFERERESRLDRTAFIIEELDYRSYEKRERFLNFCENVKVAAGKTILNFVVYAVCVSRYRCTNFKANVCAGITCFGK